MERLTQLYRKQNLKVYSFRRVQTGEHELEAVVNSGNKNEKITQFSLIKPGVNLEIFYESSGVKQALWLSLRAQDDSSQDYFLVYQSSSLMLV